jgi:hypothetical protein
MQASSYLAKARECAGAAERAQDPAVRVELYKIARAFLLLDLHGGPSPSEAPQATPTDRPCPSAPRNPLQCSTTKIRSDRCVPAGRTSASSLR